MAEDLLMSIARENFGRTKYIPVLHGRTGSIQPTTLILKQNRAWWKKPFHHTELKVLSKMEKYVDSVHQKGFREMAESSVIRMEKRLQKKEIAEVKEKHEISLKAAEHISIDCTSNCSLGDLELGMMDEEYYEDTDLRDILDSGLLSKDKMEPYLKHKLYIVTSVVYSSMFRIVGKRESRFDLSGRVNVKTKIGGWVGRFGSVGGKCSSMNCKAAMVTRKKKAPIFFTVCPVKYDESTCKLRIPDNHFVGNVVARGLTRVKLEKREDSIEDLLNVIEDYEDGEVETDSELLNIPDLETKLQAIQKLLLSTDSRSERETLVVKYLYMFESLLSGRGNRLYLNSAYDMRQHEEGFLEQIGLQLDDSTVGASDNLLQDIQDYGLILKFIAERTPEELDELEIILMEEREEEKLKEILHAADQQC